MVAAFTETAHLLDRKEQELETLRQFKVSLTTRCTADSGHSQRQWQLRAEERMAAQENAITTLARLVSFV